LAISESEEVVILQDADLGYNLAGIGDAIAPILERDADAVYGSCFLVRKASGVLYFNYCLANKGLAFLLWRQTRQDHSGPE